MFAAIVLRTMPIDSHELLEEREMRRAEALEAGQLDDRLDLALEDDRQDDDVVRRRLAQAARDRDVFLRWIHQQDALLLERALADEALAELELVRDGLALDERVARQELQERVLPARVERVEDRLLRADDRRELATG